MPSKSRRKNTTVIQRLIETPFRYSFKQAVRLLERTTSFIGGKTTTFSRHPIARFTPPLSENLRFQTQQSLSFHSCDISKISIKKNLDTPNQWRMQVNFMGLTGSSGVLPYHYTEFLLKRLRAKDVTMMEFLDIFNHRTISLFYQASVKYSLPLEYERKKLYASSLLEKDNHTQLILSLIGMGTNGLQNRLHTKDESLIYYSGLFTKKIRTTAGLQQIIQSHFSIPVEIKEFIGQWQDLIDDVRTRLPGIESPRGQNNQLGKSVMIGQKGWFSQGKIRIILGPLTQKQLHTFAPGTSTLKALDEIVKLYINFEHDYDYVMRIRRSDIPNRIHLKKSKPPIMGWNTWLSNNRQQDATHDTMVDIPVSAHRLR
jgi:type VI secretion system protein ImpH